jgi:hypothetical protein
MSLWVVQNNRCPLCQKDWVVQRIGRWNAWYFIKIISQSRWRLLQLGSNVIDLLNRGRFMPVITHLVTFMPYYQTSNNQQCGLPYLLVRTPPPIERRIWEQTRLYVSAKIIKEYRPYIADALIQYSWRPN